MIEREAAEDTAETQETRRKTTETREDGKGGTEEMRENGDGRQGRKWRWAADDRGGGDTGQRGQRRQTYRNMDTTVEEMLVKTPTPWTWTRTITSRSRGRGQSEDGIEDQYQLWRFRGSESGVCDDSLKEVVAVSQPQRRAATRRGNINGNGGKLAVAASFDNKFLASSSPPPPTGTTATRNSGSDWTVILPYPCLSPP